MSDLTPWRPGAFRRPRAERPARTPLTREQIVRAAMRIVQKEGVDAVSMRRVAAEFETGPSSLYAHVANKDELLQLMFDEMCGLIPLPVAADPGRWREQLRGLAAAGREVMIGHNDLARAGLALVPTGPNALRVSNAMMGLLLTAGLAPRTASWAMDRIFLYVTADSYEYAIWRTEVTESGRARAEYLTEIRDQVTGWFAALPADEYPHLVEHADVMFDGEVDDRFTLGLDMLLDGLERLATP